MKTSKQIQGDIYDLVKGSSLDDAVNGDVYRNGYRPRDSKKEDIIVTFTTATAGQIQEGTVTINIYYPDIDPYDNGVKVEDGKRAAEIEAAAAQWFADLPKSSDYLFSLRGAIYTMEDEPINQHFVVLHINFKILDTHY